MISASTCPHPAEPLAPAPAPKGDFTKGVIWNSLGSLMWAANSFVMLMLVSRIEPVATAGAFSIAFTTAQIAYIVGLLGLNQFQQTDYQGSYSLRAYAKGRLWGCAFMLLAVMAAILILGFSGSKVVYTLLLTALMMLNALCELFQSFFFRYDRLDLSGASLFWRTLLSLSVFALVLLLGRGLLLATLAQLAVNLLVSAVVVIRWLPAFQALERESQPRPSDDHQKLIRECLPLFASTLLMSLVVNASRYGIDILMTDEAQGYYNMIFVFALLINIFGQFMFKPLLSRCSDAAHSGDKPRLKRLLFWQVAALLGVTGLACLVAWFWGIPVLELVYARSIDHLRLPLLIVLAGSGAHALTELLFYLLVLLRRQGWILRVYAALIVVVIPLTWGLVAAAGITGAALSFLLAHCLVLLGYSWGLSRAMKEL
ncbi:MAG: lipopolysaccharide biosynthesis protein [Coriobacteriales bacterium]|nr:lipopolysaccharide biosynthesis protein [Coriobacteriales bacterium]